MLWIGENLKNLRHLQGYSQRELSELLDIPTARIWELENDYTQPSFEEVVRMKAFFYVRGSYFSQPDLLSTAKEETINGDYLSIRR